MKLTIKRMSVYLIAAFFAALCLSVYTDLSAGSRLGRVNGVMGEIISVSLGRTHGVKQGLRGRVFKFDEEKQTVNVAEIQVITVSEESCLARITERMDSIEVDQFVDIEGTEKPATLERIDIISELEENARNYFAARQYTEPDTANCLAECRELLRRDPGNRLASELIRRMKQDYLKWADREARNGNFTYALIYYARLLEIDEVDSQVYSSIWEIIEMMDVEASIELDPIVGGRPPDYYYAIADQYYINGQYEKSKAYYTFLDENFVGDDMAVREGMRKNDKMLGLVDDLRSIRESRAQQAAAEEEQRRAEIEQNRERLEQLRYFRSVAEKLFGQKNYTGSLVYYLRILDLLPGDSLSLARREFISGVGMVTIPAGEFSRGSSEREIGETRVNFGSNDLLYRELPKNWVYLDSFYIDRYEVTNRQYRHFCESTGHSPPLQWTDGSYPEGQDNHPVVYVSWLDALAYARWIGKRLPREIEWEKAARGPNGFQWPWGDRFVAHRANVKEAGKRGPLPVGSYPNGANEQGVMDLAGNVWEYMQENLEPYPGYEEDLFYFPDKIRKVIRGGSFKETGDYARGAFRGDAAVDKLYNNVGFRCARDIRATVESPETASLENEGTN